jgi:1-acylglycerone phosphate reductase
LLVGRQNSQIGLVNNAGAGYAMPISDLDIAEAKKLFDLNVWSYIAVTQAFLPLILQSRGIVVNQTSVAGSCTVPFQATYNASKAAIAIYSDSLRLELAPFGVRVIDLKTGAVRSNINDGPTNKLPKDSIYAPAREAVEKSMSFEDIAKTAMDRGVWATATVADILRKNPPPNIWRGTSAWLVWFGTKLPFGWLDGTVKKMVGLDVVEEKLKG